MPVTATVRDGCTISAPTMAFGITTPAASGKVTATSVLVLACTPSVTYTIGMDRGMHVQGNTRQMFDPVLNRYLPYEVYRDAKMTSEWGNQKTNMVSGNTGPTGRATHTAYGKIKSTTQTVRSGSYFDYIVVTVNF
ncbi:spore coat U domain-containing protein [Croceicoccus sp. BE223]|uniref:Csu type fimbrial protein n=1 Tax=Croceicoccus sp. BE223 TaxID=2817716 RepID=UPI002863B258|nr:spore coat U domain-containing protein [Croceicoccus sp. BE223]MDR7101348.1 spore coat protein U-like protein [Croceicoccus sp. BE223]